MTKLFKKEFTKEMGKFVAGGLTGFSLFTISSHNKSPVKKRIPEKRIKNISYLPSVKVYKKDEHYHIHHWMIFSLFYANLLLLLKLLKKKSLKSKILHGFFIGSIIQGLIYKDRFRVHYKQNNEI